MLPRTRDTTMSAPVIPSALGMLEYLVKFGAGREMGELGRTVEFVANLPWFRDLFTEDGLDEATSRLIAHEFPFDERLAAAAAHPPVGQPSHSRYARLTLKQLIKGEEPFRVHPSRKGSDQANSAPAI